MKLSEFKLTLATLNDNANLNNGAIELLNDWDGVSELYAAEHLDKYTPNDVVDVLHALNVALVCGAGLDRKFYVLPRI